MKIQELMERAGIKQTGLAVSYIKDGMQELNMLHETHVKVERIDITKDKRFYSLPEEVVKLKDIRCKNQLNTKDEYRSIPRAIGEPATEDADGS